MNRLLLLLAAIILVIPVLTFAQGPNKIKNLISTKWSAATITDSLGNTRQLEKGKARLSLAKEINTFEQKLHRQEELLKGNWQLEGRQLILSYDLRPAEHGIDSTVYQVIGSTPHVVFYRDGREVTRLEEDNAAIASKRSPPIRSSWWKTGCATPT